ncbi:RagB/SusD family nutrient uptake outer membrane protein [Kaistella flava (ex Peng et al. 2021)]|uniref:RagB/SusD family nutrient uptake outer membrane protein n=1 Tax=Kaistella flava (ex Peng et al. 2021) TaxID=2038776 RepID=A0A7M2Y4T1_9FLAO|nr:RagB/SusD family nutrient uptake outer membrane protein [Kaistella flava (ex Peng et al. 2021)]QOW08859.1 RagB/SusD family nutrient uptake outer membrane protein [Kaistella flava (ex Peng et al. 2021)]
MKKYIVLLASSLLLFSCRDYLDVVPLGYVIPTSVTDYELLLIGGDNGPNFTSNEDVLHLTNDNFYLSTSEVGNVNNNLNTNFALYSWSNYRFSDPTVSNTAWNSAYRNIYTYNKIINEIDNATLEVGDTEEARKQVKAQAYYGRAYEYLFLVNTFSKQYNKATASTDYGVPLVLLADVTQTLPSRGTVAGVYAQIISDLELALPHLPAKAKILLLPNIGAGYALMSRTYLYQNDYANAKKYAELALAKKSNIVDYTQPDFSNFDLAIKNNEQYATHFMLQPGNGYLSEDAMTLFPQETGDDKRLTEQFFEIPVMQDGEFVGFQYIMGTYDYNFKGTTSVSVPEMMITLAEAEARLGNPGKAIELLNNLRNKRIDGNEDLSEADFDSPNDLIKFCLDERRREMIYSNTRLFDLKRQNLEPAFAKTTLHKIEGKNPLSFTAAPNTNQLVIPIPAQVLKFNPGMPQNQ